EIDKACGVGFMALPFHGERHGLLLNLIRRADFRQARIILLEQVEKFGLTGGAVLWRIADLHERFWLALLRGIKLVVARAQDARPPNIVPESILPDVVVDRPRLGSIVPYVACEDDADQRFILA